MASRKLVVEIIGDSAGLQKAFRQSSAAGNRFGRDMNNASRGVLAATASFVGLRRAVLSTSASFLGGVGAVAVLKSTISAASEAQRVLGQTRNAVERSGLSWEQYGKRIRAAADAQARLSGFDDERLLGTFSNLVRRTDDVNEALRLNALSANVARGRAIELEAAQQLVLKASLGNVGALRRLGINIDKTATAQQALDLLNRKYANSAAVYGKTAAGAQDRFRVAIENLQETVGAELLPVITKYLNAGAKWLNNTQHQKEVTDTLKQAVAGANAVFKNAVKVVQTIDKVTGSFKRTVEILGATLIALKVQRVIDSIAGIGTASRVSAGQVGLLNRRLGRLRGTSSIVIPVVIATSVTGPLTDAWKQIFGESAFKGIAKDQTVKIGGRTFIKGSIAELEARQRQALQKRFGIPAGPNLFGLGAPGTSTTRTAAQAARITLPQVSGEANIARLQLPDLVRGSANLIPKLIPNRVRGSAQVLLESFTAPLLLQLEQAKALAFGRDMRPILLKLKAAMLRAAKSGRLSIEGQIDLYNQLAGINDQLKGQVTRDQTKFRHISVSKLLAGTSLSLDERRHIATALAQVGRGGTIPQPSLAFGGAGAQPVVFQTDLIVDGKKMASVMKTHDRKAARRRVTARRGPWAGRT